MDESGGLACSNKHMASIPLCNTRVVAMPKGAVTFYLSLSLQVLPLSVITVDENCSPATSFF